MAGWIETNGRKPGYGSTDPSMLRLKITISLRFNSSLQCQIVCWNLFTEGETP